MGRGTKLASFPGNDSFHKKGDGTSSKERTSPSKGGEEKEKSQGSSLSCKGCARAFLLKRQKERKREGALRYYFQREKRPWQHIPPEGKFHRSIWNQLPSSSEVERGPVVALPLGGRLKGGLKRK